MVGGRNITAKFYYDIFGATTLGVESENLMVRVGGMSMAEEMKPLKNGDEVHIKQWNAYGRVLFAGDQVASDDDKYYKVQIMHYFRRSELELYDPTGEREERGRILHQKTSRLEKARIAAEQELATGDVNVATFHEFVAAFNEVQKEFQS
jgi:hypothetical protein